MLLRIGNEQAELAPGWLEGAKIFENMYVNALFASDALSRFAEKEELDEFFFESILERKGLIFDRYLDYTVDFLPQVDLYELSAKQLKSYGQSKWKRVEQSLQQGDPLTDSTYFDRLQEAAFEDLMLLYPFIKAEWETINGISITYTAENAEQGRTLLKHMRDGRIPQTRLNTQAVRLVSLLPYDIEGYKVILETLEYGKEDVFRIGQAIIVSFPEQLEKFLAAERDVANESLRAEESAEEFGEIEFTEHQLHLFERMDNDNYFYKSLPQKEFDDTSLPHIFYECKKMFRESLHSNFASVVEKNEHRRFENAMRAYAILDHANERPLFMFDNTIMGSGKSGFLITDRHLYIKGGSTIAWNDVKNIECTSSSLIINKQKISLTWSVLSSSDIRLVEQLLVFACITISAFNQAYGSVGESLGKTNIGTEQDAVDYARKLVASFVDGNSFRYVAGLSSDAGSIKKFQGSVGSYAGLEKGEIPIIVFDNTLFGSAKEGCICTNRRIHIKNKLSKPQTFDYSDIHVIELRDRGENLFINGYQVYLTMLSDKETKVKFCAMLNRIRNDLTGRAAGSSEDSSARGLDAETFAKSMIDQSMLERDLRRHIFYYGQDAKSEKKFQAAPGIYTTCDPHEIFLVIYDDTAFGSAKQGCLITSEAIHVRNSFAKSVRFDWSSVVSIELRGAFSKELFINNYKVDVTLLSSKDSKRQFCGFLNEMYQALR